MIVKAGTLIRIPDGREGRIVYNGLDGQGIKFGRDPVDVDAIMRGDSGLFNTSPDDPDIRRWIPEAMLRDPYPSATVECVGEDYEVVKEADDADE